MSVQAKSTTEIIPQKQERKGEGRIKVQFKCPYPTCGAVYNYNGKMGYPQMYCAACLADRDVRQIMKVTAWRSK